MKILAIGRNYTAHIEELNNERPDEPVIFTKPETALLQKNAPFYYPDFSKNIHYEVEILLKICKNGKYIDKKFQPIDRINQPDFNRIWPGTEFPESPETRMAAEIVRIMKQRQVIASIDIHNNTGINPHYACINKLDQQYIQLASLFGRLIVYFIRPKGVQSAAFAELCPAVTLECGRPGQQFGVEHALDYLDTCLHLSELPSEPVATQNIDLYHTVAQITVKPNIDFSFHNLTADLLLTEELELMNFHIHLIHKEEIPLRTRPLHIQGQSQ